MGTLNMLGLAKRVGARLEATSLPLLFTQLFDCQVTNITPIVNRILLASTSEVYGDPIEHPQTESYFGNVNPIGKFTIRTF